METFTSEGDTGTPSLSTRSRTSSVAATDSTATNGSYILRLDHGHSASTPGHNASSITHDDQPVDDLSTQELLTPAEDARDILLTTRLVGRIRIIESIQKGSDDFRHDGNDDERYDNDIYNLNLNNQPRLPGKLEERQLHYDEPDVMVPQALLRRYLREDHAIAKTDLEKSLSQGAILARGKASRIGRSPVDCFAYVCAEERFVLRVVAVGARHTTWQCYDQTNDLLIKTTTVSADTHIRGAASRQMPDPIRQVEFGEAGRATCVMCCTKREVYVFRITLASARNLIITLAAHIKSSDLSNERPVHAAMGIRNAGKLIVVTHTGTVTIWAIPGAKPTVHRFAAASPVVVDWFRAPLETATAETLTRSAHWHPGTTQAIITACRAEINVIQLASETESLRLLVVEPGERILSVTCRPMPLSILDPACICVLTTERIHMLLLPHDSPFHISHCTSWRHHMHAWGLHILPLRTAVNTLSVMLHAALSHHVQVFSWTAPASNARPGGPSASREELMRNTELLHLVRQHRVCSMVLFDGRHESSAALSISSIVILDEQANLVIVHAAHAQPSVIFTQFKSTASRLKLTAQDEIIDEAILQEDSDVVDDDNIIGDDDIFTSQVGVGEIERYGVNSPVAASTKRSRGRVKVDPDEIILELRPILDLAEGRLIMTDKATQGQEADEKPLLKASDPVLPLSRYLPISKLPTDLDDADVVVERLVRDWIDGGSGQVFQVPGWSRTAVPPELAISAEGMSGEELYPAILPWYGPPSSSRALTQRQIDELEAAARRAATGLPLASIILARTDDIVAGAAGAREPTLADCVVRSQCRPAKAPGILASILAEWKLGTPVTDYQWRSVDDEQYEPTRMHGEHSGRNADESEHDGHQHHLHTPSRPTDVVLPTIGLPSISRRERGEESYDVPASQGDFGRVRFDVPQNQAAPSMTQVPAGHRSTQSGPFSSQLSQTGFHNTHSTPQIAMTQTEPGRFGGRVGGAADSGKMPVARKRRRAGF
ncbi:hypothetical protein PYCC9005_001615 [Savitreella phatthalungensis]